MAELIRVLVVNSLVFLSIDIQILILLILSLNLPRYRSAFDPHSAYSWAKLPVPPVASRIVRFLAWPGRTASHRRADLSHKFGKVRSHALFNFKLIALASSPANLVPSRTRGIIRWYSSSPSPNWVRPQTVPVDGMIETVREEGDAEDSRAVESRCGTWLI